jgi:hypothetical protein
MHRIYLLVAMLLFTLTAGRASFGEEQSKGRDLEREFPGQCPGEGGCQFGVWTAKAPIAAYSKRSTNSPVVFRLSKGEKVTGLSAIMVVHKPGACTAKKNASITRLVGEDTKIPDGTKLPMYFYGGEGGVLVEFKGEVVLACCEDDQLVCEKNPVTDLWLQIRSESGRTGWTNQRGKFSGTSQYD